MRRLMTVCALTAAFFVFAPGASAQDAAAKRAAAERLAAAMGFDPVQIVMQTVEPALMGLLQGVREENPDIPPRALEIMGEEFSAMARSMVEILGPQAQSLSADLTVKYYTADEINAIAAFYESPAGREMTAGAPQIIAEITAIMGAGGPDEPRCAGVSAARCAAAERLVKVDPTAQMLNTLPPDIDRHKMLDWTVTLNAKYFSEDTLNAAAAFYGSPAGRKSAETAAPMMNDILGWIQTEMGAVLGREIPAAMERVKTRLEAEGLDPDQ